MNKRECLLITSFILILFFCTGCAHTKSKVYINPNTNFRFIKKVAVLPFENFSQDRYADKKLREIFVTTLLASEAVDVPEMGDVIQVLNSLGIEPGLPPEQSAFGAQPMQRSSGGTITKDTAKALGDALGIQGIILGSVNEYSINRSTSGSFPEVSLTLRMIDPKTGSIIWAVSHNEQGGVILPSIIGIGEETLTETAIKASKRIVDTLVYK